MADSGIKRIWVKLKKENLDESTEAVCIEVNGKEDGKEIRQRLVQLFNLHMTEDYVMKLRNHRGSLVPISANIPASSKAVPYSVEVVGVHENVKAIPRTVKIHSYNNTMKDKLSDISHRIEKLETAAPQLRELRNSKIDCEMQELEKMLQFLNKRVTEAENTKWKGMFKKNPLW